MTSNNQENLIKDDKKNKLLIEILIETSKIKKQLKDLIKRNELLIKINKINKELKERKRDLQTKAKEIDVLLKTCSQCDELFLLEYDEKYLSTCKKHNN